MLLVLLGGEARALGGKLVETVSMRVGASQKEVLKKILKVQEEMEREQESRLVDGVLAELRDGALQVTGRILIDP